MTRIPEDGCSMIDVASPCVRTCRIDADGFCQGCRRTLDEIARWGSATVEERLRIVGLLPGRTTCHTFLD
jgi:predicted Fe-S protein YdhL (DUF1289 family)